MKKYTPKKEWLDAHAAIFKDKTVLDLAVSNGVSSQRILDHGARHVYAVEIRPETLEIAKQNISNQNIDFIIGDITDYNFIPSLVNKSNVISCLGVVYHLFDHFRFFNHICQPNIEYILIETLFGPETANPEMFWNFEITDDVNHGWAPGCDLIPNGIPNLSWIINSVRIFGFECDYIECYGVKQESVTRKFLTYEDYVNVKGEDWPPFSDIINENIKIPKFVEDEIATMLTHFPTEHKRMVLRLYNTNLIKSQPLDIADIYKWPF